MAKQAYKEEELQEAFTMHCSPDNTLPIGKMGIVIRSVGLAPTQSQLKELNDQLTSRGKKTLTLQEINAICQKYHFLPESTENLLEAFRIFDKEGSGMLNSKDLRHILGNLGEKLTDEELDEMIRETDITGDGLINYNALVKVIESGL